MKYRLDIALVERKLAESRRKAQECIKKGFVTVNGKVSLKSSASVAETDVLEITQKEKYVGRGGEKLEAALAHFKIDVRDKIALDVGASTGGFTDCLLQNGAKKVTAIDVGSGQLAEKLRNDPRVELRENINARDLSPKDFDGKFDVITIDVSFISILKILPAVLKLAGNSCVLIALVKPQFEVGKDGLGKGGVVKDQALREACVKQVEDFLKEQKCWRFLGTILSPIQGDKGNIEYLIGISSICTEKLTN